MDPTDRKVWTTSWTKYYWRQLYLVPLYLPKGIQSDAFQRDYMPTLHHLIIDHMLYLNNEIVRYRGQSHRHKRDWALRA